MQIFKIVIFWILVHYATMTTQWVLRGNYQALQFQLLPPMFERLGNKDKSFGHHINLKYVYNLVPETQGPVKFTCTSSFFLKGLLSKYHQ